MILSLRYFLIKLLNICLKNNIFEFGGKLYKQLIGTAMGIQPAPFYENVCMAKLDDQTVKLANTYTLTDEYPRKIWKRFLDDCFGIWTDSIEKLYQFLDDISKIQPTIKFTLKHSSPFFCVLKDEHDCWCHETKSISFLDSKLYIEDGKITIDLYRKPTDTCMYLLPSSCHPAHISKNIN